MKKNKQNINNTNSAPVSDNSQQATNNANASQKNAPEQKKHHPGDENLRPFNKQTVEEQRELAVKGGIASGEARRRKRDALAFYKIICEATATQKDRDALEAAGLIKEGEELYKGDLVTFSLYREALRGNIGAIRTWIALGKSIQEKQEAERTNLIEALQGTAEQDWNTAIAPKEDKNNQQVVEEAIEGEIKEIPNETETIQQETTPGT